MKPWRILVGRRSRAPVDPFSVLEVQWALGRLDREITSLLCDERGFARAHHLHAAMGAYCQALSEACELAGIEVRPQLGAIARVLAEAELRLRGWTW